MQNKDREQLPGSSKSGTKKTLSMIKKLSMFDFIPDEKRINEALWNDKEGFEGIQKKNAEKLKGFKL